jgi:hypothetical protein
MKHIKKFNNGELLDAYKKSNFVTPHIYLDTNLNTVKFMQEYKQLEYISSTQTGGQYIDLGCHLMENTDDIQIDIKFNIKGEGKSSAGLGSDTRLGTLIGSQPEKSPWPGFILRIYSTNYNNIHLQAKWSFTNSVKRGGDAKYDSKCLSYYRGKGDMISGAECGNIYEFSETLDNIPQSQVSNTTCTLFCAYNRSNIPFRFCEADLYYLKFTKGGQTIRNLIPVKKVATNEIGLYDIENDHLYVSQGDDPFVAGPTI